ncbi:unnamed protein product [Gongylonema pulchrum]|uniref:Ubiquitinyl hydrolase 1 n=1 Tax=Gongylonema pulchrum TaxID=637853 RepID=A0A183E0C8_9BILA|nr:unnamed protein product [Gongylonema pulchrum]
MANEMAEKWACAQCTYANYQAATTCTMCRAPRSLFITNPPCTSASACDEESVEERWPCPDCTYMNVMKSRRCTVCFCLRPALFNVDGSVDLCYKGWPNLFFRSETVRNVLKCVVSRKIEVRLGGRSAGMRLIAAVSDECSVDLEQLDKLGKIMHKWDCSQCTYKNWPSVKLCTMCGTPKECVSSNVGSDTTSDKDSNASPACYSLSEEGTERGSEGTVTEESTVEKTGIEEMACVAEKTVIEGMACEEAAAEKTSDEGIASEEGAAGQGKTVDESVDKGAASSDVELVASAKATVIKINGNVNKRITCLDKYLSQLYKSVDTGCASFLEAVTEILRQSNEAEEKLIHYIYHYGEGNRRLNGFEAMLLSGIEGVNTTPIFGRSIVDIIRNNHSKLLACVPRNPHYLDERINHSFCFTASGDRSDDIFKKIRESIYEDYDMTRIANNSVLFTLPNGTIYDLRPWLASGESSLRVLMEIDDRQIMDTVCCMDAHSLTGFKACDTYAPLVLRNRGGGHSLVDAVSQALWGVIDKNNTLRGALYHSLYAMETVFRSRWATSLMKMGLNIDIWKMQRHWSSIVECKQPGSPLEQIHILVLAQVLNRPIIVFPIESSKMNPFPSRNGCPSRLKHPVEGYYPQLPGMNNFRVCPPLLLGFINGSFHALVLPPRPASERADAARLSRIYRYVRCPPFPLNEYLQFVLDEKEAEEIMKGCMVVDVDGSGQRWIYHSNFGSHHTKNEMGFLLWSKFRF